MRALAVLAICVAATAHAEDGPPADAGKQARGIAAALVLKGDAAARDNQPAAARRHYEQAIAAFERALATDRDPGTLLALAEIEEKAGQHVRAAEHYRAVARRTEIHPNMSKQAADRFEAIVATLGLVTIATEPSGATVTVDGRAVGTTPLAEPLVLSPGTYRIAVVAPRRQRREIELTVEAGSESERTLTLAPRSSPDRRPLYIGAAATGGFALIATITGIAAVARHNTFTNENLGPGAREDARSSGKTLALVTDLCLVGAVAAGGFTAYWYFAKYRRAKGNRAGERRPDFSTKAAVAPWVKPDAGGLALAGSF